MIRTAAVAPSGPFKVPFNINLVLSKTAVFRGAL